MARQLLMRTLLGGMGTMNFSRQPAYIKDTDLVDMNNLTYEHDTWQKAGGAAKINTTAVTSNPAITGLIEFVTDAAVRETIAMTSDGKIITVDADGIDKTLKSTGVGTDQMAVFAEGSITGGTLKRLFIVNGSMTVQMYDGGATTADITNPSPDWAAKPPTWCAVHNNRLWVGGAGHRIYASVKDNYDDFVTAQTSADAQTFNVYPGEGTKVTGAVSWRGRLWLFKSPTGVYYLDDESVDPTQWVLQRTGRYVGLAGPRAFVEALDDVIFVSPDGFIHALSGVQEYGDVKSSAILPNEIGTFIRERVDFNRIGRVQSMYLATKRKIYFGFTRTGDLVNTLIVGLDTHRSNEVQAFVSDRDICEAMATYTNPTTKLQHPMLGDDNGFIWEIEKDAREKDGTGYTGRYSTYDVALFEHGTQRANLRELEIEFVSQGTHNIMIDILRDGAYSETVSLSMGGLGVGLGVFVLDTDVLGVDSLQNSRARLHGDCRRIALEAYNSGQGENFSIASQTIKYLPGSFR